MNYKTHNSTFSLVFLFQLQILEINRFSNTLIYNNKSVLLKIVMSPTQSNYPRFLHSFFLIFFFRFALRSSFLSSQSKVEVVKDAGNCISSLRNLRSDFSFPEIENRIYIYIFQLCTQIAYYTICSSD